MTKYNCFDCNKKITLTGKKVRCPYCGSKMLFKSRNATTKIKAR
jgi:DNA-directed RNA polymerase subunit RPC12/RpoP